MNRVSINAGRGIDTRVVNLPGLIFVMFVLAFPCPGKAQDDAPQSGTPNETELVGLAEEISSLERTIAELVPRLDSSSGIDRRVLDERLGRARMELMRRNLQFARAAAALEAGVAGYDQFRSQAVEITNDQTRLLRLIASDLRRRITLPEPSATAAEQASAYSRIFELLHRQDQAYGIYIESLELSRGFGIDVGALETRVRQDLAERAANGSALLDIAVSDMNALRASLAAVPGNEDIKARLSVVTSNVTRMAEVLGEVLGFMDNLDLDTAEYREQLLSVTGQITSEFFDFGVLSSLVVGWSETLWDGVIENGPGLLFKIILFFVLVYIFYKLANLAQSVVDRAISSAHRQPSQLLRRMALMAVRNSITVIGILIALSQVGISLGPLLAGLGVVGFIVGFALQDTLSNFASGMMILIYRPFDVDDYVEAAGISGLVSSMSLVNTTILTFDNQTIVVPNNKIWGDVIRNVTAQKIRRVDLVFGISYGDDIARAEKVLKEIVDSQETVLDEPEPMIRVHELGDSSVNFIVRPWVGTADYWETYWAITREVKMRFDAEGISIPFPQRDVHVHQS